MNSPIKISKGTVSSTLPMRGGNVVGSPADKGAAQGAGKVGRYPMKQKMVPMRTKMKPVPGPKQKIVKEAKPKNEMDATNLTQVNGKPLGRSRVGRY